MKIFTGGLNDYTSFSYENYLFDLYRHEKRCSAKKQRKRNRRKSYRAERKKYGFDSRQIKDMRITYGKWLCSFLKMFLIISNEDLEQRHYEFKGRKLTQKEMINLAIKKLEFALDFYHDFEIMNFPEIKALTEASQIWTMLLPSMWE